MVVSESPENHQRLDQGHDNIHVDGIGMLIFTVVVYIHIPHFVFSHRANFKAIADPIAEIQPETHP